MEQRVEGVRVEVVLLSNKEVVYIGYWTAVPRIGDQLAIDAERIYSVFLVGWFPRDAGGVAAIIHVVPEPLEQAEDEPQNDEYEHVRERFEYAAEHGEAIGVFSDKDVVWLHNQLKQTD